LQRPFFTHYYLISASVCLLQAQIARKKGRKLHDSFSILCAYFFTGNTNFEPVKPVTYILIILFSFISFGISLTFFSTLSHIRTEMKEKVQEDSHVQCLIFSQETYSQLKWEEKNREFRLKGKMYDVSAIKTQGDKVLVYCMFDKYETRLRDQLINLFSDKPGNKSPFRLWVQILAQNYLSPAEFTLPLFHQDYILIQSPYIFRIHTFENELADPPPRG